MGNIFSIQCGDALAGRCWDCISMKSQYISGLEDNLLALQAARDRLSEKRNDLRQTVINQQTPQMEQTDQVKGWLSRADHTVTQVDGLLARGSEERHKLCMAGYCSNNCISTYNLGRRVTRSLDLVNALMAEANFSQVVVSVPAEKLESNLRELRNAKEDMQALMEDLQQRISLEEGPEIRTLKQVQVWLSKAEKLIAEADKLLEDGVQELNKLLSGDITNSVIVGRVAQKLEDIVLLHSKGDFSKVTAKAVPRRVVGRYQKPALGTEEMVEEAWSVLHKAEVGIIGIYGMGGVGKTTLLTQINNKFASLPNQFDAVIWVVVSKDVKLDNIQVSIWKQIRTLDDRWPEKSPQEKADDISSALNGKQFLLLLDDVWKRIDLEEIGVPLPDPQNGYKIVLTTRSFAVCKQMEATHTMKVKPLNREEAWKLFEQKSGKINGDILQVARKVADECRGLPIALITIGRAMASRSTLEEWEHALKVLRRSVSNLQGTKDELYRDVEVCVFQRLKFSYDALPNNTLQSCFLYCALFPEDFKIMKHDLVRYWVAEKFCGRHEGYGIVYTLIRQCLLEEDGDYVKLHDMVRDMAVWIVCECEKENHKFFTQTGTQLIQLPEATEWEGAKKVSFMANSFTSIEGSPRCAHLVTLFLSHNLQLKIISEGFFQCMTRLTVLDLSHTEIKVLPWEILNLQSLEFLNLSHTKLEKLPTEMKRLARLKYLNLESTFCLEMIPVQVISNLSELQVLNMFQCGSTLYEDVGNNVFSVDGNLLIEELMCLKNLSELSLTVRSASFLYSICSNQKLLKSVHALHLSAIKGTKALNISPLTNAKQLKLLDVVTNFELEELVIEEKGMQALWSSLSNNSPIFSGLCEVNLDANYNIRHVTWLIFAPQLTVLKARRNDHLEEIISAKKLSKHQSRVEHLNLFAKLQVLELYDLQKLRTVFPIALSFPCLTQIDVRRCPALKKLPLNSKSAEGCNVVIKAQESWWKKLTWEDDETEAAFSSCFQKI